MRKDLILGFFNDEVIVTRIEVNGKNKHISKPSKSIQIL
jgi:hypothetical protein